MPTDRMLSGVLVPAVGTQVLKYTLADVHHVICVSHTSKVRGAG